MSAYTFVEKTVEVKGSKQTILTQRREKLKRVMDNKEETDERIHEMSKDTSDDQETFFELQVHKSWVRVSRKVIESSQVWLDTIDSTDPEDDNPIMIPSFITKQMILDLVEMVEKDDMECAHLGKLVIRTFKCQNSWKCFSSRVTLVPPRLPGCSRFPLLRQTEGRCRGEN